MAGQRRISRADMETDVVAVRIPLEDGRVMNLRFRLNVFQRLAAEARAKGSTLQDYLARRVLASGVGEEASGRQDWGQLCTPALAR
jgi:hypothetical protein